MSGLLDWCVDSLICGDNVSVLRHFPDNCIDLTVTSPPYDNLRKYKGYSFDFEGVVQELHRVTKLGGVVVWVVGDATVKGSETGSSFRQALRFMEIGFNLHDTMIYHKLVTLPRQNNRYEQAFEYMFILSKGKPNTVNLRRVPCVQAGVTKRTSARDHDSDGLAYRLGTVKATKLDTNVWSYRIGANMTTTDKEAFGQPAIFPEKLAEDHILSWSNTDDIVLDPFVGSGTTAKMAFLNERHYIGIDCSWEYINDIAMPRLVKAQERKRNPMMVTPPPKRKSIPSDDGQLHFDSLWAM